ncbi:hypothetical protein TWF225_004124 [Orbilia oligospora]|nr:hypothetical protein TWF225_004124 [Orbilia oligospora]
MGLLTMPKPAGIRGCSPVFEPSCRPSSLALQWIFRHGKLGRRGNLTASIDVTSHGGSRYAHRSMHDSDLPAAALPLPQNRETFKAGCLRVIE